MIISQSFYINSHIMPSWRNCVALLPLKEKVKGSSPFGGTT